MHKEQQVCIGRRLGMDGGVKQAQDCYSGGGLVCNIIAVGTLVTDFTKLKVLIKEKPQC